jgi:polysaccharide deacetylase family protein (PEP-CTERM system associated)
VGKDLTMQHDLAAKMVNAFSVDVEDYFQVESFKTAVKRASWDHRPARVVQNTERVLELLENAETRATFFMLGWVAERFPSLVRRIQAGNHEIASHGYAHEAACDQTPEQFRSDVRRAKQVLEDQAGVSVRGYRAPTFSITARNWWAYEILASEGYEYSSSLYPIAHDLYGLPRGPRVPFRPMASQPFVELPLPTLRLFNRNRPCGGGGWFRLFPYALSRWCIGRINRADKIPCIFYCHPWEFDPGQPRIHGIPFKSRLRHYLNLSAMERRIQYLLQDYAWGRIDEVVLPSARFAEAWTCQ